MKKILITALLSLPFLVANAQDNITVCHTPSTEKFAHFASNDNFNNEHPMPRVYKHVSQAGGEMIKFTCADGSTGNAYLLKAKKNTNNWIFVFQEWWGLNDNIKRQAEDLYNSLGNVNVLAIDMYDGKVATDRENAGKFMQEFKQERGNIIVSGAIAYAGKNARIGTVGWCFGGGQSIQAALTAGNQTAACVMYYGMPEENVEKLKNLNSDVLFIFAEKDQWINKDVVSRFEQNAKAAGKNLTVKSYNAAHGFANPSNPMGAFDENAYKDAYAATVAFFKARLK
ncbi:MAG: dienelactone hydrolase family protein [Cyclobacteriaceae bacterium]|jgi:carboxymethylenebutenolidase|nr:dienelactone hydrolase family protein [Cyclobacteriaceae bacterium]